MASLLKKAHYLPTGLVGLYGLILVLLTLPPIQREALFLHHVRFPFFADFSNPERYGLAPFKTRNLKLETSDGESIGAWHVLPRSIYTSTNPFPPQSPLGEEVFDQALKDRPTLIYFHGNAGNRAIAHSVRAYSGFSNYLDCNVLAVDYRGFADSSGTPSEAGLLSDARAAYDFVHGKIFSGKSAGANPQSTREADQQIIVAGHSLGTGVVSALAGRLASEGRSPRAIVLISPFTSLKELLTSYKLFRFIPILGPLSSFPKAQRWFHSFIYHPFDSKTALTNTTSPILLLHAINDMSIPPSHSADLFTFLSRPHATKLVEETTYEGWGIVRSFDRGSEKGGEVVWWEGRKGGHNNLGWAEGSLDLIKRIARL
ncbi:hypothetical protein CI109_105265 [Kwoniella shandongensis]|uniref:AB hydrolase-1 domain-containing protein n=1 Tax=Kwoniella shandongensis TaxID=1734106 RepID=A0A5M6C7B8_9TREE|nr:uncharacterized protein CI109_002108 [Kwoniella shandongensis]KAA5529682.1 hypothetical protein CI109_002108 [Kwoniella shandongensis]